MSIEVRMPALSPTMEMGTLARWLVKEGDEVASGDIIAEIETDKATMEVESADDGTVGRLLVADGTADIPVNTVIAVLLEEGEDAADIKLPDAAKPAPAAPEKAQEAGPEAKQPTKASTTAAASPAAERAEAAPRPAAAEAGEGHRILVSPLARRMAEQSGLDLSTIKGSGPGGRIVKRDVEGVEPAEARPAAAKAPAAAPAAGDAPYEERRLTTMRKVIAERMTEAKATVPHFYLNVEVEMDRLLKLRGKLNAEEEVKISVNDFLIKALGLALLRTPDANVQFAGDKIRQFSRADVAVAVAIEGGLITPVVRDVGAKGLGVIGTEMRDLAARAREGQLAPEEYKGGTISLSNLGMFGIREFEAIINPPHAAILAVGAAEERPVVRKGKIRTATIMNATLSCDHRAMDGAIGARLLVAFKELVENPLKMLL